MADWNNKVQNPDGIELVSSKPKEEWVLVKARAHSYFKDKKGNNFVCVSIGTGCPKRVFRLTNDGYSEEVPSSQSGAFYIVVTWTNEINAEKIDKPGF